MSKKETVGIRFNLKSSGAKFKVADSWYGASLYDSHSHIPLIFDEIFYSLIFQFCWRMNATIFESCEVHYDDIKIISHRD